MAWTDDSESKLLEKEGALQPETWEITWAGEREETQADVVLR